MPYRRPDLDRNFLTPSPVNPESFQDPRAALDRINELYDRSKKFLQDQFLDVINGNYKSERAVRAYYPLVRATCRTYRLEQSVLSSGRFAGPGTYETTVTRPDIFHDYLLQQLTDVVDINHVTIEVGESDTPIPIHFVLSNIGSLGETATLDHDFRKLRDHFDVPDLGRINDDIASGEVEYSLDDINPMAFFTAPRIDYSLKRLEHYTACQASHFQKFVIFTNYELYMDRFVEFARDALSDADNEYMCLYQSGNVTTRKVNGKLVTIGGTPAKPQMPACHLVRKGNTGITLVNIGVGPSNAKTITDHVATLRPEAWLMLGHCAGLRETQNLGDYVLAQAYVREDKVLDDLVPIWVPVPALADVQIALEKAVEEISGVSGRELKRLMRIGTVTSVDDRNWELHDVGEILRKLAKSRAIALDMESAVIAANGFRFRVPYGALLCVSDRPLHGEIKLPGIATNFYRTQVEGHLRIGIRAMELMRAMPTEKLHSRKLRSIYEVAFR